MVIADLFERIVSNAVVKQKGGNNRLYIGHEIEQCRDYFGLYYRRPFEKVCVHVLWLEQLRKLTANTGHFERLGCPESCLG